MIRNAWLVALIAALAMTLGCGKKEEAAAPAAPAMDEPAAQPAPEPAMEQHEEAAAETHGAADPAPMEAEASASAGQQIYEQTCFACHNTGAAGAPKLGDQQTWSALAEEGIDELVDVAIHGEGAMPPRGGNPDLTDEQIRAAVTYMVEKGK